MRPLFTLGFLMTLCASASAATVHSVDYVRYHGSYGRYHGSYGRYYGYSQFGPHYGYSQYYGGGPNNRGGLVGGDDAGTYKP
jgi:hypothetical protein